jgi:hypothetical protein
MISSNHESFVLRLFKELHVRDELKKSFKANEHRYTFTWLAKYRRDVIQSMRASAPRTNYISPSPTRLLN